MHLAFSAETGGRLERRGWRMMRRAPGRCTGRNCVDALRDRRTLLVVLLSSVAIGPVVLVLISAAGGRHREARRGARGRRARHRARADAAQLPRAPDLHGARGARRLRAAAQGQHSSATRCWWCRRASRPIWRGGKAPVLELLASATNQRSQSGSGPVAAPAARLQPGAGDAAAGGARRLAGGAGGAAHRGARPGRPGQPRRAVVDDGAVLRAHGGALRRAERGAGHDGRRARARLAGAAADEPGAARWRWCWASGARWPAWAS